MGRQSSRKVQVEHATLSLAILSFSRRRVGIGFFGEPTLYDLDQSDQIVFDTKLKNFAWEESRLIRFLSVKIQVIDLSQYKSLKSG